MTYVIVKNRGGDYAVDWETVARLNLSYHTTDYQWRRSIITNMSDSTWYNPLSWSLPTIKTVDVDWNTVRTYADISATADLNRFKRTAKFNLRDIAYELEWQVKQTASNLTDFRNQLIDVQHINASAIENAVDDYDGMIEAAHFVRDTSANMVVVGSTIATGGAAAGMLSGGALLKSIAKYQDTGKAGAALIQGAGTMTLGRFKIAGSSVTAGGEMALLIAKGALDSATSLAAGDSFAKAIEKGGLKVASDGFSQVLFNTPITKKLFNKMPVPFTIWGTKVTTDSGWQSTDVAKATVEKIAKGLVIGEIKKNLSQVGSPMPEKIPVRTSSSGFADVVPVKNKILLHFSIIHMEKGVGNGW